MNKHERIGAGGEMNLREMLTPHAAGKDFLPECYDIKKLCGCLGNPGAFEIIRSRVLEAAEGSPSACKHIRFKLHNLADTFFLDEQGMMRFYRIFKDYFQEAQLDDVIDYLYHTNEAGRAEHTINEIYRRATVKQIRQHYEALNPELRDSQEKEVCEELRRKIEKELSNRTLRNKICGFFKAVREWIEVKLYRRKWYRRYNSIIKQISVEESREKHVNS